MAIVDGEKKLTLLELYNDITAQAWSMFDSDVDGQDEFESNVMTSIQKALSDLWNSYNFPFKQKTHIIPTKAGASNYEMPVGNIIEETIKGKKNYGVFCNGKNLKYNQDYRYSDAETGEPEYFYILQDRIYLYPVPDDRYTLTIDYESLYPACDEDGTEKATLEDETDYVNLPERYQELFKFTLMPLAMWKYLIASEMDENSEAYKIQYQRAYKRLIQYTRGINRDKTIGWRD